MRHRGLEGSIIVRDKVNDIEDYWQAADLGFFTSETESFCLSILEGMVFACPSVSTSVGGIPEVVENEVTEALVPFGDAASLARAVTTLVQDPAPARAWPCGAKRRPRPLFRGGYRAKVSGALSAGV